MGFSTLGEPFVYTWPNVYPEANKISCVLNLNAEVGHHRYGTAERLAVIRSLLTSSGYRRWGVLLLRQKKPGEGNPSVVRLRHEWKQPEN